MYDRFDKDKNDVDAKEESFGPHDKRTDPKLAFHEF